MIRRALLIAYVWPEPQSSAAGLRNHNVIDALQSQGWEVHVASGSEDSGIPAARPVLESKGVRTHTIRLNDSAFDAWIAGLAPEVVIYDRFLTEEQYGWRVQEQVPQALRVLDTIDLHFLRRAREAHFAQHGEMLEDSALAELETPDLLRELASIYRCDLTLILSSFEYRLLQDAYGVPAELLACVRFFYPARPQVSPGFEDRQGCMFIGNFRHPPNADAVRWLAREVWPEVRKLRPDAVLSVYGAYPSREFMDLKQPGIEVKGPIPRTEDALLKSRVNLAPLRFGAGIKGKVSDAWYWGTPVVGTPIAAEGMVDGDDFAGLIATGAVGFAAAVARLLSDREAWEAQQQAGFVILDRDYLFEKKAPEFVKLLEAALENRVTTRLKNRVGALLWSEDRRSARYFSKWIEVKEKLQSITSSS